MLIQLYWILGYLGCALFTMLICPPIMWMLDSHIRPGTYKDMWDYAYKGERVAHSVRLYSDGHLENIATHEFYWIEKAAKAILPEFSNEMVNLRIEKIL